MDQSCSDRLLYFYAFTVDDSGKVSKELINSAGIRKKNPE